MRWVKWGMMGSGFGNRQIKYDTKYELAVKYGKRFEILSLEIQ